jgi:hypothetical protein
MRYAHRREPGFAGRAPPVIVGVAKAVHRRGVGVVEFVQIATRMQARCIRDAGEALCLGNGLRLQRRQKHPRVETIQAPAQRRAASGQVER